MFSLKLPPGYPESFALKLARALGWTPPEPVVLTTIAEALKDHLPPKPSPQNRRERRAADARARRR